MAFGDGKIRSRPRRRRSRSTVEGVIVVVGSRSRTVEVSSFRFQVREKRMAKVQKFEELKIWQVAREIAKCA